MLFLWVGCQTGVFCYFAFVRFWRSLAIHSPLSFFLRWGIERFLLAFVMVQKRTRAYFSFVINQVFFGGQRKYNRAMTQQERKRKEWQTSHLIILFYFIFFGGRGVFKSYYRRVAILWVSGKLIILNSSSCQKKECYGICNGALWGWVRTEVGYFGLLDCEKEKKKAGWQQREMNGVEFWLTLLMGCVIVDPH